MMLFFERIKLIRRKLFFQKGLVVDIGAGHNPSMFASLIIEKYIDDSTHRQGQVMDTDSTIILQADIENIPLKNNAIDFSICSHVLEHVMDPEAAVKEISRVSRQGYLELPTKFSEYLFDRDDHLWLCSLQEGGVVCMEPKPRNFEKEFASLFKVFLSRRHKAWYQFYFKTFYDWNICLRWYGSLPILVEGRPEKTFLETNQSVRLRDYSGLSKVESYFKKIIRKNIIRPADLNSVIEKMQCNTCCTAFKQENLNLVCECGVTYKVDGNILRICNAES